MAAWQILRPESVAAYRPSSDASEATVAYHLRIEPALDVLHSLGQRQWGEQRRITYIYIHTYAYILSIFYAPSCWLQHCCGSLSGLDPEDAKPNKPIFIGWIPLDRLHMITHTHPATISHLVVPSSYIHRWIQLVYWSSLGWLVKRLVVTT